MAKITRRRFMDKSLAGAAAALVSMAVGAAVAQDPKTATRPVRACAVSLSWEATGQAGYMAGYYLKL